MIEYTLPDFTTGLGLNLAFICAMQEHPEWALPDVRVASVYGNFPGCRMNGGRAVVGEPWDDARIERTCRILASRGVELRLTLTNVFAGPEELDDPYTRRILEMCAGFGAGAIVYRDEVADELRHRYPEMPLTLSTARGMTDLDETNAALERYEHVVLTYHLNKDDAFIGALAHPEKLEVMVNEFCPPDCPNRARHYELSSRQQMTGELSSFRCSTPRTPADLHVPGDAVVFTNDEVRDLHERHGVSLFKLAGRGRPFEENLESLSYYLFRPEYREQMKEMGRRLAEKF